MKNTLCILTILFFTLRLTAQTNAPIQLALLSESDEAATAVDVLTAELSSHKDLQLLERSEIDKVYREQGLAAGSRDDLKLGRILGADGLLLLETTQSGTNQYLNVRLIAVKPGVVLMAERFSWPLPEFNGWALLVANHINPLLPKLTVLLKDAIPISVVNLRSAISSDEARETERQLKSLVIQRLSQEPRLFVLERQKMQLLTEEKDLKMDDSAFWNGSYLLEGVVDQNGYSAGTVTINARLTPKGGEPVLLEASGSRTNFAVVINQLAAKVAEALKVNSTITEWNPADEASQYFDEAKWALRWGIQDEAQTALESAWALGMHNAGCAELRTRAYMRAIDTGGFTEMDYPFGSTGNLTMVTNAAWNYASDRPWGLVLSEQAWQPNMVITFAYANKYPDIKNLDLAIRALEVYQESSQIFPQENLKTNSAWFGLGVEDLTVASQVLLHFNFVHSSQKIAPDKLAQLRSLARSIADWISSFPVVRDTYWSGNSNAADGEVANAPAPHDIFGCEVTWGFLWQEKPEDGVAIYRELMSSAAFRQIHQGLWFRPSLTAWNSDRSINFTIVTTPITIPALAAWNDEDRKRVPTVWNDFIQELKNSTNRLSQIEGAASSLNAEQLREKDEEGWLTIERTKSDEDFDQEKEYLNQWMSYNCILTSDQAERFKAKQFDAVEFQSVFKFRDYSILQANQISPMVDDLRKILATKADGAPNEDKQKLLTGIALVETLQDDVQRILKAAAETAAAKEKAETAKQNLAAFENQKQFLTNNQPFDPQKFVPLFIFGFKDYSKTQALEIQPLLAEYKTKLTGIWATVGSIQVGQVQANVNRILNPPPAPKPNVAMAQRTNPAPIPVVPQKIVPRVPEQPPEIVTNILIVKNYLKIPKNQVAAPYIRNMQIASHRWTGGKLLIDLRYEGSFMDGDFNLPYNPSTGAHGVNYLGAIAIFDPTNDTWQLVEYPPDIESKQNDPDDGEDPMVRMVNNSIELFNGDIFLSCSDRIHKYNFKTQNWQVLAFPEQQQSTLYAIDGHLYSVNNESILEITDDGQGTRILASTRRRPAAATLDSLDGFGSPILFSSSNDLLCAIIGNSIFCWDGKDWRAALPSGSAPWQQLFPESFDEGFIFRTISSDRRQNQTDLWVLKKDLSAPELRLRNDSDNLFLRPLWMTDPQRQELPKPVFTLSESNLYFLVDHTIGSSISGHWTAIEKDGYNARLLCFSRDWLEPYIVPLKIDFEHGQAAIGSGRDKPTDQYTLVTDSTWIHFAGDCLYIGQSETLGIWAIPIADIEASITLQKQARLAAKKQEADRVRHLWEALLAKYDRNHNGVIDPDEKEQALDDPAFIESKLDEIDANHNGWLEASELVWFDANNNKILEPKEQAGIEIAQHLLAVKLMKKFDAHGDGILDRSEFNELMQAREANSTQPMSRMWFPFQAGNNDGHIDLTELERLMNQRTRAGLRSPRIFGTMMFNQMHMDPSQPVDPRQLFKAAVEAYWQNPGSITNQLPTINRMPYGAGFVPNRTP
jgi:Ca2+-binding EF-hand superfamily protein